MKLATQQTTQLLTDINTMNTGDIIMFELSTNSKSSEMVKLRYNNIDCDIQANYNYYSTVISMLLLEYNKLTTVQGGADNANKCNVIAGSSHATIAEIYNVSIVGISEIKHGYVYCLVK